MPAQKVEAGPRSNAETGLGNVFGLGSFDTSLSIILRPNRQVAVADATGHVVALLPTPAAARALLREQVRP